MFQISFPRHENRCHFLAPITGSTIFYQLIITSNENLKKSNNITSVIGKLTHIRRDFSTIFRFSRGCTRAHEGECKQLTHTVQI